MVGLPPQLRQLILNFSSVIGTIPTAESFTVLVLGWILCQGRSDVEPVPDAGLRPANRDSCPVDEVALDFAIQC